MHRLIFVHQEAHFNDTGYGLTPLNSFLPYHTKVDLPSLPPIPTRLLSFFLEAERDRGTRSTNSTKRDGTGGAFEPGSKEKKKNDMAAATKEKQGAEWPSSVSMPDVFPHLHRGWMHLLQARFPFVIPRAQKDLYIIDGG